jgi:hypothetical protein
VVNGVLIGEEDVVMATQKKKTESADEAREHFFVANAVVLEKSKDSTALTT